MFHELPLEGRARAFLELAKLAKPGPDHGRLLTIAEVLAFGPAHDGDPRLTPALMLALAEHVHCAGMVAAGRHGHPVYDMPSLTRIIGSRAAATTILRLAGATPDESGRWVDCAYADSDAVPVTFPADFFSEVTAFLGSPCNDE